MSFKLIASEVDGEHKLIVAFDSSIGDDLEYAVYFIHNKEKVSIIWYQKSNVFDFPKVEFSVIHAFVKDSSGRKFQKKEYFIKKINLADPDSHFDFNQSIATNILKNNVWHTPKFGNVYLGPNYGVDWDKNPFSNRSWVWLLHQLYFIQDLLAFDKANNTIEGLLFSDYIIKNWYESHKSIEFSSSNVVWHDHGTALRLRRILNVKEELIKNDLMDANTNKTYSHLIKLHINYLADNKYYSKGTNHGLDQTLTLFSALEKHGDESWIDQYIEICKNRLAYEIEKMFACDGGHFENSTNYQGLGITQLIMIYRLLKKSKLITFGPSVFSTDLIDKATYVLSFMLTPVGKFIPIGDTEEVVPAKVFSGYLPNTHVYFEYAVSKCQSGEKPKENFIVLPHSGWAFFRSGWIGVNDFYLAAKCGFKSNYHRQDDDTSFCIYYKSEEWFIDSGLYKYQEDDSIRKHVRSHFAHNMSYPNNVNPVRNINHYKGQTLLSINENQIKDDVEFSLNMSTEIFENFTSYRTLTVYSSMSFSIQDRILTNKIGSHNYITQFIIPNDKQIVVDNNNVDIIGENAILRLKLDLSPIDIEVSEVFISKEFNKLEKAQVLRFHYNMDTFNALYECEWLFY